jgi:amino acid adenylation domain-containing protein
MDALLARSTLACVGQDAGLTYADLADDRDALGQVLVERGLTRGSKAVLFGNRSCESIVALLAIQAVGAAYVPLDITGPTLRLQKIIADVQPALAVAATGLHDRAIDVVAGACPVVDATDRTGLPHEPTAGPGADDLAYVIFTSGSTGPPRGVEVTHRNVTALARARRDVFGTLSPTILLTWPLVFDGSVAVMRWAFDHGGTLVLATDEQVRDVHRLADLIEARGITHLSMVPVLYSLLLDARPGSLRGLRVVVVAGDVVPTELVRRHCRLLPDVRLVNEYGPTECTVWSTYHDLSPADADRASVPIGRPVPGVHVHVTDGQGQLVSGSATGELVIGGDTVAGGYLCDAALTQQRFRPDPWCGTGRVYLTGDLVSEAPDGLLAFAGRKDDQVKVNGYRVEPGEVEAALRAHDSVLTAAVVAAVLPSEQRVLVAYAQLRTGHQATGDDLLGFLRDRVSDYMMPRQVIILDRLPATPAGKVDRQALAIRGVPGTEPRAAAPADAPAEQTAGSSGELELLIATAWGQVTGTGDIQPTTNFFDSGGDSLRLAELQTLLAGHDIRVRVTELFAHPSPRELAAWLAGDGGDARAAVQVTERGKLMRRLLAGRGAGRRGT